MNPIIQMLESKIFIGCLDLRSLGLQQYDLLIYCIKEVLFLFFLFPPPSQHFHSKVGIHTQVTDHSECI